MLLWLCTVLPNCISVTLPRMANQNSNKLLNLGKSMDMINDVTSLHQDCRPGCRGPLQWNLKSKDRRGLDTRTGHPLCYLWLRIGGYTLYEEVETDSPEKKAAAVNLGLQVGLSQTPLDNDGVRKILFSTNTPSLPRKSLQKHKKSHGHDRVCEWGWHESQMDVNTLRGSDSPHAIPVQSDGMYNNPL